MLRLQRFLAIPMAATAVGCLWLLYRLGGDGTLFDATWLASFLAVLLCIYGFSQRGEWKLGWIALVAVAALVPLSISIMPTRGQSATARIPLGAEAWSEAAVEKYRADHKPLFVYFTADWCLTCKANETAAIERTATRDAFRKAGVKVLVGDWTNGDPAITRFLESRGRAGVPLYLWYEPGKAEPEELPQILTPGMLSERASRRR